MLAQLAQGGTYRGIALEMGISKYTVKNHITAILYKLGARNQPEAVSIAYQTRILPVPPLPGTSPDYTLDPEDARNPDAAPQS